MQRAAKQLQRFAVSALLRAKHAEQMLGVDVMGLFGENLFVSAFGSIEIALLLPFHGVLEIAGNSLLAFSDGRPGLPHVLLPHMQLHF